MEAWAVPFGALVVSLATLVFTGLSLRQRATEAHVDAVERGIRDDLASVKEKLRGCEEDRLRYLGDLKSLRDENLDLMRKLVRANGGTA